VGPNHKSKELKDRQATHSVIQAETWWLRSYIGSQEYPMLESRWKLRGVASLQAIHHLQTDSIKLVEAPLNLYIRILTVEFTHTHRRSPVGSRELSRVFARAPEVVSEIDELLYPYLSL
jgi:hypothetical protein